MKTLVINGPNLNMLGKREPEIYGNMDLKAIEAYTRDGLKKLGHEIEQEWFQSNSEEKIIEKIQSLTSSDFKLLVINPAAFSHTSVAILDALKMISIPIVEVHISNTQVREEFRTKKVTAKASTAVVEGMGYKGYLLAILSQLLEDGS